MLASMMTQCLFCAQHVDLVYVHGHYQCPRCGTNALPCCDGDNCSTNYLLQEQTGVADTIHSNSTTTQHNSDLE
jgi:predicted RNA-binding Zn-ribbon protein involved in translation (DUF1610 family)